MGCSPSKIPVASCSGHVEEPDTMARGKVVITCPPKLNAYRTVVLEHVEHGRLVKEYRAGGSENAYVCVDLPPHVKDGETYEFDIQQAIPDVVCSL